VDIHGDSTVTSLDRADSIECLSYEQGLVLPGDGSSGMAIGRRQYRPLIIRKRIDRSSPLLAKALTRNEVIEGSFKFFRQSPTGDGTINQFYTVHIGQARVAGIRQYVLDTSTPGSANESPLEEVTFIYRTISWTYTEGNVTHQDALT
jgi:type VI secretion system secreted protein Hcp